MTRLRIETQLDYRFEAPTDCLLQIEAAHCPGQRVLSESLSTTLLDAFLRQPAEDGLGTRAWFQAEGRCQVRYTAEVEVTREASDLAALPATAPRGLPPGATRYLLPSRYAQSDRFEEIARVDFAGLGGGALAIAIRDYVAGVLRYVPGASGPATRAGDTYLARQGVCRDYAHLLIALARAAGLPARMASVYAPDVTPPDLHAVAEVWLAGAWYLLDATGMAQASDMAVIGVGRDAAEVAFLTTIGPTDLVAQSVKVGRLTR